MHDNNVFFVVSMAKVVCFYFFVKKVSCGIYTEMDCLGDHQAL